MFNVHNVTVYIHKVIVACCILTAVITPNDVFNVWQLNFTLAITYTQKYSSINISHTSKIAIWKNGTRVTSMRAIIFFNIFRLVSFPSLYMHNIFHSEQ